MVDEKGVQAGKPFHQWLQSRTAFMNKKYNASYNTGPQAHNSKWDKRDVSASKYWFHVKNNNESMVKVSFINDLLYLLKLQANLFRMANIWIQETTTFFRVSSHITFASKNFGSI